MVPEQRPRSPRSPGLWLLPLLRALSLPYVKHMIKAQRLNIIRHILTTPRAQTPPSPPSAICSALWLGRRSNRRCLLSVLRRSHSWHSI